MACTTYTLLQYTTLTEAIALGATKVKYGDKEVDYRSMDEMLRIKQLMEACLFPGNNTNNGRRLASFSKGTLPCGRRYRF